jgi:hypothetical protein
MQRRAIAAATGKRDLIEQSELLDVPEGSHVGVLVGALQMSHARKGVNVADVLATKDLLLENGGHEERAWQL